MDVPDGTAVDELWENQSYVPIKGWGGPYALMNRYTDITGTICYSDDNFPDIPLPEGWMWTTEWTIDTTCSFTTDEEGWAYGHTWDRLFEAIQKNLSTSDSSTTLVRRRKWIRGRVCVTSSAMEQLQGQRDAIISQYNTIKTMIHNKCADYERISSHHETYTRDTTSLMLRHDNSLSALQQMTSQMIHHLEELLTFLEDIAQIERDYSAKLTNISRKYQHRHANDAPFLLPSSTTSNMETNDTSNQDEVEDSFVEVPSDAPSNEPKPAPSIQSIPPIAAQFYETIHNMSSSLEAQLSDYCVLLLTITTDVREQLGRLKNHLKAVKAASQLRENINNVQNEMDKAYQLYCTQHSQTTAALTHALDLYSKHIDSNFTTSRPFLPCFSGSDPYTCYHQFATQLNKHKTLFETFSSSFTNVMMQQQPLSSQYRFVFITTLQLLSHEKNRIFAENSESLQEMTKTIVSSNPKIDFDVDASLRKMPSPLESSDLSDVLCSVAASVQSEFGDVTLTVTTFGMMHIHAPFSALHSYTLKGSEVRDVSTIDDQIADTKTLQLRLAQQPSTSILSSGKSSDVVTVTCSRQDAEVLLAALSDVILGVRLVDITVPSTKKNRRRSSAGVPSHSSSNSVMKKSDDAILLAQQAMLLAGSDDAEDDESARDIMQEDESGEYDI